MKYVFQLFSLLCLTRLMAEMHVNCPAGWKRWNQKCFWASNALVNFNQNRRECELFNAQMVSIETSEENEFVYSLTKNDWFWVGLHVSGNNTDNFWWTNGKKVNFKNWASGQPDELKSAEGGCVVFVGSTRKWDDISCTRVANKMCQIDLDVLPEVIGLLQSNLTDLAAKIDEIILSSEIVETNMKSLKSVKKNFDTEMQLIKNEVNENSAFVQQQTNYSETNFMDINVKLSDLENWAISAESRSESNKNDLLKLINENTQKINSAFSKLSIISTAVNENNNLTSCQFDVLQSHLRLVVKNLSDINNAIHEIVSLNSVKDEEKIESNEGFQLSIKEIILYILTAFNTIAIITVTLK
ncbi:hypothetical protein B4U80_11659, partial [Leptotrombidium deliense]